MLVQDRAPAAAHEGCVRGRGSRGWRVAQAHEAVLPYFVLPYFQDGKVSYFQDGKEMSWKRWR